MTNGSFEHSDGDLSVVVRQLKDHMGRIFQKQPVRGTGTITAVEYHPTQGYPMSALATINGAQNQRLEVGANHRIVKGEVWNFIADEDNVGRIWVPRTCIVTDQGSIGVNYALPLPVISVPVSGMRVGRDGDYIRDASGGLVQTHLWVNYRAIVKGIYDLFGSHVTQVTIQVREFGSTTWRYLNTVILRPRVVMSGTLGPVFLFLNAPFMVGDTSMQVAVPFDDYPTDENYILNQPVYWGIENETFEGVYNGVAPFGQITSITNRTPDSGSLQNHINTDPSRPIQVTLFSGQIDIGGLSSSTVDNTIHYEMQIAGMKDQHLGPWSLFIPFEGWLALDPPADVTNFVVQQVDTGITLTWSPIASPNLRGYRIYRYDSVTPPTTPMVVPDPLPAGMKYIQSASRNSTALHIPSPDATDPIYVTAYGTGDWFGIAGFDSTGNVGRIVWSRDIVPPPHPLPESWTIESLDIALHFQFYPERDTQSIMIDPGFEQFVLFRATSADGVGATPDPIAYFGKSTSILDYYPPLDRGYVYQLASKDRAGNISVRINNDLYWKSGIPNLATTVGIRNGTFNIPGFSQTSHLANITSGSNLFTAPDINFPHDTSNDPQGFAQNYIGTQVIIFGAGPSGSALYAQIIAYNSVHGVQIQPAASTTVVNGLAVIGNLPDKWGLGIFLSNNSYNIIPPSWTIDYLATGGINGSRVMRIGIPAGDTGHIFALTQRVVSPYNSGHTGMMNHVWLKAPAALATHFSISSYAELYGDNFGRTYATGPIVHYALSGGLNAPDTGTVDGAWHGYSFAQDDETMFGGVYDPMPVAFRYALVLSVNNPTGTIQYIYIDDVSTEYE